MVISILIVLFLFRWSRSTTPGIREWRDRRYCHGWGWQFRYHPWNHSRGSFLDRNRSYHRYRSQKCAQDLWSDLGPSNFRYTGSPGYGYPSLGHVGTVRVPRF